MENAGVKATNKDWKPSPSECDAYKDEARRLEADGGTDPRLNYNKINQKGSKYMNQDGDR